MSATETKILSLAALADRVAALKAQGLRVVQSHGVFDLLHPGHIRHFDAARKEGDVLVVTITPDRFVSKGPGRPVFTDALRAESLAALGVVDYVAVTEAPTAVEAIRLLKPDIYAKGSDYQAREDDLTGMIFEEERAVVEAGGRIQFTDEITFSSSALVNSHFDVYTPEASEFLTGFRARHSDREVIDLLKSMSALKVLVVGDAIIDEYVFCRAYGMASKSASIAAQFQREEAHAGGAMAIANHVAGFCESVALVTCLGALDSREELIRSSLKPNVTPTFHSRPDAPTTTKRRYVHSFLLTKMFELTHFNDEPLSAEIAEAVADDLRARASESDLVIVADFGHGLFSQSVIEALAGNARFLALNAQTNAVNYGFNPVTRWPRADYVSIDSEEAHLAYGDRNAPLDDVLEHLAPRLGADVFAVTRGQAGASVRGSSGDVTTVPVFSSEVVDTTGAGDAFLALTAPCAALGADPEVIGFVGNAAGALAVRIVGNQRSIEPVPLFKFVTALLK
jgi:rfaE bifunctional protein nucleotidyltransferase chain/domain